MGLPSLHQLTGSFAAGKLADIVARPDEVRQSPGATENRLPGWSMTW